MSTVVGNSFMSEDRKPPRAIRVKTMPSTTVAARTCKDRTDGFGELLKSRGRSCSSDRTESCMLITQLAFTELSSEC
jgi:hypothetical protein